ncbi:MAG: hypothetical protein GY953_37845 [bacterium]|nr:hypothetical protein [bacterium]
MFFLSKKKRNELPEKAQLSKYYEMDGQLRAYADRMAVMALVCGFLAVGALSFAAYVRLQPPVVIRVDHKGEARVIGGRALNAGNGFLQTFNTSADRDESAPTDVEGRGMVRRFLMRYLTYTPSNVERNFAEALNVMTRNFRTLTLNKLRDKDIVGKIKADGITSTIKIRSIEPVPGMPWTYQAFAAKEVHRLSSHGTEYTDKMVCRYQVRLVQSRRSQTNPSGLLVGEFWEQQMVSERDIDLEQNSGLLDR